MPHPLEAEQHLGELAAGDRVEVGRGFVEHEDLRAGTRARWPARPVGAARRTGAAGSGRGRRACRRRRARRRPVRRSAGPVTPKLAGPKATSSPTVGMNSWSSGSWKTIPTRRRISRRVAGSTGSPPTLDAAGAGAQDAVEVQHQRRLARPVRPEQRDPLTGLDAQVDPVQGLVAVGVGERHAADVQGRRPARADRASAATVTARSRDAPAGGGEQDGHPGGGQARDPLAAARGALGGLRQRPRRTRGRAWRGAPVRRARRRG